MRSGEKGGNYVLVLGGWSHNKAFIDSPTASDGKCMPVLLLHVMEVVARGAHGKVAPLSTTTTN